MDLRDVTRAIIAEVERTSGYPVLVTEDRSLATLASVRMARGNAPAMLNTIRYHPAASTQLDYLIACQCGFILRLFANPPSERWDFAPGAHGREIVHRLLGGPEGPARKLHLQPHAVEKLRDQLCLMYVGFKMVAPEQDVGFDLAGEYAMAKTMHQGEGKASD